MKPEPTGETHEVAPHELFFSTTDNKGVIELSNEVFNRLARYDAAELRGAPHNIVRHPDMPGAVFKLMWDKISGGKTFAGYIFNLAADGSRYDVFATVTPLPSGGYLSVRSRPCSEETYGRVLQIYERVAAAERACRAEGTNRRESAAQGADVLLNEINQLGFDSYDAFQTVLLPEEVTAREKAGAEFPVRPGLTTLDDMLDTVHREYDMLEKWLAEPSRVASANQNAAEPSNENSGEPNNDVPDVQAQNLLAVALAHVNTAGNFLAELIDAGFDAQIGMPGEAAGYASRDLGSTPEPETRNEREVRERLEALDMLSQVLEEDVENLQRHAQSRQANRQETPNGAVSAQNATVPSPEFFEELNNLVMEIHAKVLMIHG